MSESVVLGWNYVLLTVGHRCTVFFSLKDVGYKNYNWVVKNQGDIVFYSEQGKRDANKQLLPIAYNRKTIGFFACCIYILFIYRQTSNWNKKLQSFKWYIEGTWFLNGNLLFMINVENFGIKRSFVSNWKKRIHWTKKTYFCLSILHHLVINFFL